MLDKNHGLKPLKNAGFWTLKNGLFYSLERRLYYVEHQSSLFRALFSSKLDEDKTLNLW